MKGNLHGSLHGSAFQGDAVPTLGVSGNDSVAGPHNVGLLEV